MFSKGRRGGWREERRDCYRKVVKEGRKEGKKERKKDKIKPASVVKCVVLT